MMGAYRYCRRCGSPMAQPTFRQAVRKVHPCDCGADNMEYYDYETALDHLDELVTTLRSRIEVLEQVVTAMNVERTFTT